jgi:hypothetical protein
MTETKLGCEAVFAEMIMHAACNFDNPLVKTQSTHNNNSLIHGISLQIVEKPIYYH